MRLTPKGGRDAIDGIETLADGRDGAEAAGARRAHRWSKPMTRLIHLIAKTLDVAPRGVNLAAGETARIKRIVIDGDAQALAAKLERIAGKDR